MSNNYYGYFIPDGLECVWRLIEDFEEYYWTSGCGHDWTLDEGTPEDNEMKYCPFCGKKLVVK